jgi:sortase A
MIAKNKLLYYAGNALIVLSLAGFLYIFSPIVMIYLFPPKPDYTASAKGTYLSIPKIYAYSQVIENVDPFDESEYQRELKKGVAHAEGTSLPDEEGTIFMFAHSSGPPWEITRLNTIFLRLGELEKGDIIEISKNGKQYKYKVREKKEVKPTEVSYLLETERTQLILQTCTPIGTDIRRLLVFADPI